MSQALRRSTGATLAVVDVSVHGEEIERLIGSDSTPKLLASDQSIEDPVEFALEKHLEEFLVTNWKQTSLGKEFDIYEEDGEIAGQQYPSDTGPIDILAISKDRKALLVVELKKGRASDVVVGQTLRYMGFVQHELAEPGQIVRGIIVALEDDPKLRRALSVTPGIEFYRYAVSFKLTKA
jgi:restriction system protein